MDNYVYSLVDALVLSTLGANSKYWEIEVHGEDRDKTAFIPITENFAPSIYRSDMKMLLKPSNAL